MKFIGFALIEIKGAPGTGHNYEIVEYSKFGTCEHKIVNRTQLKNDWGDAFKAKPENGAQYGLMMQSEVIILSKTMFEVQLSKWNDALNGKV